MNQDSATLNANKMGDEQEIISLLTSLVRCHYLEKSGQYHMAMDFEKLFKLDTLHQLNKLEDLDQLKSLDELKSLDNLRQMKELRELTHLSELKSLEHLDRLNGLKELSSLENLSRLTQLEQLNHLSLLNELKRLDELKKLDQLKDLNSLKELESLSHLTKLDELKELKRLEILERLEQLKRLEELKNLESLNRLDDLSKLDVINKLSELLREHRTTLAPLESLNELKNLSSLKELRSMEQLSNLNYLERLKDLEKLDRIEDAKFAERLDKLDKLDVLKSGTRKLVVQQVIGTGLEFLKIAIAGVLVFFFLSLETGREITAKALPALGFGESAQVNLALKLLVNETTPEFFESTLRDLRKRIAQELTHVFSLNSLHPLSRRLELLQNVQNYSFVSNGIDLVQENKKLIDSHLADLENDTLAKIEYEYSHAKSKGEADKEDKLRVIKLLLLQKKYPQLLEVTLPQWEKTSAATASALLASIQLQINDTATLKEILREQQRKKNL